MPVRLPIENLPALWPSDLRGAAVGAVLHPASVDRRLCHTSQLLEQVGDSLLHLRALFGPQHGYLGQTQDNMIEWQSYTHPRLGIPVYSLYGEHREPTPDMLAGLDVVAVDLQDIGARYYTFIWTLYLVMQACECAGKTVVVFDRPNPLSGAITEGPTADPAYRSFVGLHPLPIRHGQTIGELALRFQREAFPRCDVRALPMEGWDRAMWWDQTGLPWTLPSPNMPTLDTATVYPGMCLLEGTNLSEGRGTTRPFELFGAPWIDAETMSVDLNALALPGVFFRQAWFQPGFQKYAGELCGGAQLHVTDRQVFQPFHTALEILRYIRRQYPTHFAWKLPPYEYEYVKLPIEILLGGPVGDFFPEN